MALIQLTQTESGTVFNLEDSDIVTFYAKGSQTVVKYSSTDIDIYKSTNVDESPSAILALSSIMITTTNSEGVTIYLNPLRVIKVVEIDSLAVIFYDNGGVDEEKINLGVTKSAFLALMPIPLEGYLPLTGGTLTGNLEVQGQAFSSSPSTVTPTGTTQTIDWDNGNEQPIDLDLATGSVTLTLSNPNKGATYIIPVIQGRTTPRDLIYPASVLWAGGVAPVITTDLSAKDLIVLYYNGTNYLGSFNQAYA